MPLPLLLLGAAAALGATGFGLGVHGGVKVKKAHDKLSEAQKRDCFNRARLDKLNRRTCASMDELGKNEMNVLAEFDEFSKLFERIKNKPVFEDFEMGQVAVPVFSGEELKKASVGASVLIGGLGGAVLGTAGGFAASGATTAAVMALGTASTGTAISSLSGVAATNATLAVLGGGSIAAGGGGIAMGTTVLGAATLGVGLLVGGIVFSVTGSVLSGKADEAWDTMLKNEKEIKAICNYLAELDETAKAYNGLLVKMQRLYRKQLEMMRAAVDAHGSGHVDWSVLTDGEKLVVENMVMIVSVLYNMCTVQLVLQSSEGKLNKINHPDILKAEQEAQDTLARFKNVA